MGNVQGMSLARTERTQLADLLVELGPEQPTLCEGWDTGDLLAHLLIRERRPDAVPGAFLSFAKPWTDKVAAGYLEQPWPELVELYRAGPPAWNPTRIPKVDAMTNSAEMFIHHEDARRGQPDWQPRELDPQDTAALTAMVDSAVVKVAVRKVGVGLDAELPDGSRIQLRDGEPLAVVAGAPGEILLWSSGRSACRIELSGDDAAVAAVRAAGFSG